LADVTHTHRPPVLGDVARAAGVSVPTVSRVLTGSTPVSEEKREAVLKAIRDLGYRPNAAARTLVSGKRSLIAVLAGRTSEAGSAGTIQGIVDVARDAGYSVVITVVETEAPEDVSAALDLALSQPVAGAIVLEYDRPGQAALAALPASLPRVVAGPTPTGPRDVAVASLDARAGAKAAVEYLLDLGHTTVHHLARSSELHPLTRTAGWREALEGRGLAVPPAVECDGDTAASGYRAAGELLAAAPDVTAVFCGSDELAIGALRRLQEAGLRVPEDISVFGCEGLAVGEFWLPALSTIRLDFEEIGRRAAELLLTLLETGTSPMTSTGQPELVLRASTGPPPEQLPGPGVH
jgi:DNA-binding LacI/PurR family transcriptional regulator